MQWCADQSAEATSQISGILDQLIQDSERVASMSDTALQALKSVKDDIVSNLADSGQDRVQNLSKALRDIRNQHSEIGDVINPIVEALQFQDRITQNMDNLGRMLNVWWEFRGSMQDRDIISDDDLKEFGQKLLKCTTMVEERQILQNAIPGLEVEEEETGAVMF